MLLDEYYRADPELRDVWIALPGTVRAQILQWDARVTTKGELQKLAEGFAHGARRLGTALLCRAQRGGLHGLYGDVPDLFEQFLQLLPSETAALELCQMRRRFKGGAAREHAAQLQRAPGERDLAAAAELPLHAA